MRLDRELNAVELQAFANELDALRRQTVADLGAADARYIRRVRGVVRLCCWSGRALLMLGWFPPTWLLGTFLLGLGKILENMELGHNVMHGQYDWMNDPEFAGRQYEWDIVGPADFWRHTHNHVHHTYTNVLGMDDDVGYGVVRLFPEQRWKPFYRWQPLWVTLQALLFFLEIVDLHQQMLRHLTPGALMVSGLALQVGLLRAHRLQVAARHAGDAVGVSAFIIRQQEVSA